MNLQKISNGVWEPERPVKSTKDFYELIEYNFHPGEKTEGKCNLKDYIWRGEPEPDNPLTSSFDRAINEAKRKDSRVELLKKHRQAFLYAARGRMDRLGLSIAELKHYVKSGTLNENHLWAFGQHYGLKTLLLDWTTSPFVAAFFAFENEKKQNNEKKTNNVYVYGLKYKKLCEESKKEQKYDNPFRPVQYFSPMSSEFGRITSQQGIFIFTEDGESIKTWVKKLFDNKTNEKILIEIKIKRELRDSFLKNLNVMGINHRTIYPDIEGAAKFCNLGLEIDDGYADAYLPDE